MKEPLKLHFVNIVNMSQWSQSHGDHFKDPFEREMENEAGSACVIDRSLPGPKGDVPVTTSTSMTIVQLRIIKSLF